eukprot:CAMPEP_0204214862 /NCGR_PEP_ID=MMETSP0361-20130328/77013_1 /ASSEMBLY_ACC=CAM_ASM_000343 /TAXON_ID=268821 /ORGANISM="Scrippsiella Hangoei, Strain SHTV-5" /LENGTH=56 /DNA_ID=CAMNT_0051179537 /DNA_START=8 /DNA_END=175 /DNA_ORIENTATION=+
MRTTSILARLEGDEDLGLGRRGRRAGPPFETREPTVDLGLIDTSQHDTSSSCWDED